MTSCASKLDPAGNPAAAGFRFPAEAAPHSRCWMAWPGGRRWHARAPGLAGDLLRLARTIAECEPVTILAPPARQREVSTLAGGNIEVLPFEFGDIWLRDTGPTFLTSDGGQLAGTAWRFNAWGGKERHFEADRTLAARLLDHLRVPCFDAPLVNEGGAICSDGEGTILTTESVLLNRNRNPGLDRAEIERRLRAFTGARKLVWIPGSPKEPITDGHVDGLAVFVRPGVVLAEVSADRGDPEYAALQANVGALRGATDASGHRLEVLSLTRARWNSRWPDDFAASYVNFYLANGAVIVPRFGDLVADEAAAETIAAAFPRRRVVTIRIDAIAAGGGGIHCVTQQQPQTAEEGPWM